MPSMAHATVVSKIAGEASIVNRYCLILDPSNEEYVLMPTADNMNCIGFANDGQATSGNHLPVHTSSGDERYCVASAAITKGDLLMTASGGRVKTASTSGTVYVVGIALEAASAAGDLVRILTRHMVVAY